MRVDGAPKGAVYHSYGAGKLVWKITNLKREAAAVNGMRISFTVSGACADLAVFFKGPAATYSMFSTDNNKCPTTSLGF